MGHRTAAQITIEPALLVVIGGSLEAVQLVLRRYPKGFSDDPMVRRICAWRKGRK